MSDMANIPISTLSPSLAEHETKHIKAIVTLIWPYSSSTHQCALLLAEPDFRLRRRRGQVRVQLLGSSACRVAQSGISIGDEVVLGLRGVSWLKDEGNIQTPGKSVDWELQFKHRLVIEIFRDSQHFASLNVEKGSLSPDASPVRAQESDPETQKPPVQWASPAFVRRRISSGSYLDPAYDPLEIERANKRRRTSWRDSREWKLVEGAPSPTKKNALLADDEDSLFSTWKPEAKELPQSSPGSPLQHKSKAHAVFQLSRPESFDNQEASPLPEGNHATPLELLSSPTTSEPGLQETSNGPTAQVEDVVRIDKERDAFHSIDQAGPPLDPLSGTDDRDTWHDQYEPPNLSQSHFVDSHSHHYNRTAESIAVESQSAVEQERPDESGLEDHSEIDEENEGESDVEEDSEIDEEDESDIDRDGGSEDNIESMDSVEYMHRKTKRFSDEDDASTELNTESASEDEEEDSDEDAAKTAPPVVISLLSDSEEDEDDQIPRQGQKAPQSSNDSEASMRPPPTLKPQLILSRLNPTVTTHQHPQPFLATDNPSTPSTPVLIPQASSALPLISPFPADTSERPNLSDIKDEPSTSFTWASYPGATSSKPSSWEGAHTSTLPVDQGSDIDRNFDNDDDSNSNCSPSEARSDQLTNSFENATQDAQVSAGASKDLTPDREPKSLDYKAVGTGEYSRPINTNAFPNLFGSSFGSTIRQPSMPSPNTDQDDGITEVDEDNPDHDSFQVFHPDPDAILAPHGEVNTMKREILETQGADLFAVPTDENVSGPPQIPPNHSNKKTNLKDEQRAQDVTALTLSDLPPEYPLHTNQTSQSDGRTLNQPPRLQLPVIVDLGSSDAKDEPEGSSQNHAFDERQGSSSLDRNKTLSTNLEQEYVEQTNRPSAILNQLDVNNAKDVSLEQTSPGSSGIPPAPPHALQASKRHAQISEHPQSSASSLRGVSKSAEGLIYVKDSEDSSLISEVSGSNQILSESVDTVVAGSPTTSIDDNGAAEEHPHEPENNPIRTWKSPPPNSRPLKHSLTPPSYSPITPARLTLDDAITDETKHDRSSQATQKAHTSDQRLFSPLSHDYEQFTYDILDDGAFDSDNALAADGVPESGTSPQVQSTAESSMDIASSKIKSDLPIPLETGQEARSLVQTDTQDNQGLPWNSSLTMEGLSPVQEDNDQERHLLSSSPTTVQETVDLTMSSSPAAVKQNEPKETSAQNPTSHVFVDKEPLLSSPPYVIQETMDVDSSTPERVEDPTRIPQVDSLVRKETPAQSERRSEHESLSQSSPVNTGSDMLYRKVDQLLTEASSGNSYLAKHSLGHSTTYNDTLPMTPEASQQPQSFTQTSFQPAQRQGSLPMTPQLTQAATNSVSFRSDVPDRQAAQATSDVVEIPDGAQDVTNDRLESTAKTTATADAAIDDIVPERDAPESRLSKKTPGRVSEVPRVLSPWFAPSKQSQGAPELTSPKRNQRSAPEPFDSPSRHTRSHSRQQSKELTNSQSNVATPPSTKRSRNTMVSLPADSPRNASQGLRTSLSYYTPLSAIQPHLNHQTTSLDIIALCLSPSRRPVRAPKGPRDYYTTFFVTDVSIFPQRRNVQIFRPWKAALPETLPGDIILLREMRVRGYKTKNGQSSIGLLSGDESAWCVWKFDEDTNSDKPMWAKKHSSGTIEGKEEIKGPPVEIGEVEREEAKKLSNWWVDEVQESLKQAQEAPTSSGATVVDSEA